MRSRSIDEHGALMAELRATGRTHLYRCDIHDRTSRSGCPDCPGDHLAGEHRAARSPACRLCERELSEQKASLAAIPPNPYRDWNDR